MKKLLLCIMLVLTTVSVGAQTVMRGDANNDKKVDAKDIIEVSNAIMGEPSANYNKDNADANMDGKVNIADIVTILNMLESGSGNPILMLWKKDGQIAKFGFTEKPVITYSGSDLILTTTKTTVQYPIYMLQKITFDASDELANNIEGPGVKAETLFIFTDNALAISDGDPGSLVYISNMSGVMPDQYRLDSEGQTFIALPDKDKSIYLVKTNHFTFKLRIS